MAVRFHRFRKGICLKSVTLLRSIFTASLLIPLAATAGQATRESFGHTADGQNVDIVTLTNSHGMRARVMSYGASLQSLLVPDRSGKLVDVVLGYDTLQGYLDRRQYLGATVGRYANRIAHGKFTLDGKTYSLTLNDGTNSLHGGTKGFDMQVWKVLDVKSGPTPSVTMEYVSPDGDQGYPGTLTVKATYMLSDDNQLKIAYVATTDKPTIVNLSNHTYWNLGGEGSGSVMDQTLMIPGNDITPVSDAASIPTGEIASVAGTPYDFRVAKPIGRDIRDGRSQQLLFGKGYDMNWVLSRKEIEPRVVARVEDPHSGRVMTVWSSKPGLQFYSGNFLDGTTVGKDHHIYRQGDAFVLEPQLFPDTPNHADFGSARLAPGDIYKNVIVYRFGIDQAAK
ncbi:galactose mutarotase [Dyella nitratireducens]